MRAKSVFLLMLALGCGLVASIGITQVMAKRDAGPDVSQAEMDAIFVALQDIPMGEPVTAQMVKLEEWPKGKIPEGALGKIEDLENRRTKTKLYKGSPVLDNLLLSEGASELGASGQIPKGCRVVAVRVDNVSGSNMIRPGDRVDVLVHLTRNPAKEIAETTTRTILQDIKVFAVNDVYDLETTDSEAKLIAQTISLLVPLDLAEKVILADELGDIRLVMRGPDDKDVDPTGGARPNELFGPTDSSDRDKESLVLDTGPKVDPSRDNDFIDFLNAQQGGTPSLVLPEPSESWTIRTIVGSDVNEVVLQLDAKDTTADGKPSGFSFWKLISSSVGAARDTVAGPQAVVEPADEPQDEPAKGGEEQEDGVREDD